MREYKLITLNHKNLTLNKLGKYMVADSNKATTLEQLKNQFGLGELYYLNTCNRVTYFFTLEKELDSNFLEEFFKYINPFITAEELKVGINKCEFLEGVDAIKHYFSIPASMDSLVLGENEIMHQFKTAYTFCKSHNLIGDKLRLANEQAILAAKEIYTLTGIAKKPISVASLAVTELVKSCKYLASKVLIIGAGQTNHLVAKFLKKKGFSNFLVVNRGKENGEMLAQKLNCKFELLENLTVIDFEPDVIITCTASAEPILTLDSYKQIVKSGKATTILDIAVPNNVSKDLMEDSNVQYIEMEHLRNLARDNMDFRQEELLKAEELLQKSVTKFTKTYKARNIEIAFKDLPIDVKAVKEKALTQVFRKEISELDDTSKETLQKVVNYMEKKYIGLPIKKAKQAISEL